MIVSRQYLPRPRFEEQEDNSQYVARVSPIAKDIEGFNNLHCGRATLTQTPELITIPKVEEYD
jgi:hypothetical protein